MTLYLDPSTDRKADMKRLSTARSSLIGALAFSLLNICTATPIEQPYKGVDKINILQTNKAGLKVYDVQPRGALGNDDFLDDYYINTGPKNNGGFKVKAEDIGKQVPIFTAEDVKKFGLHCEYLCADAEGNVVGRVYLPKIDAKRLNAGKK